MLALSVFFYAFAPIKIKLLLKCLMFLKLIDSKKKTHTFVFYNYQREYVFEVTNPNSIKFLS